MTDSGKSTLSTYFYSPEFGIQQEAWVLIFTSSAEKLTFTLSLAETKTNAP